jgi:hypothetical protein
MLLMHMPPLMMSKGKLNWRCQSVVSDRGEMPTRRLATDVEAIGVAVETSGIPVHPSNGATDLVGENHQVAADILYPGEVGNDIMRPSGKEHFGWSRELLRGPLRQAPPWMKMKTGASLRRARYMSNRSISAEP